MHARTKHIDIQYHFIQERTLLGEILISYISTLTEEADCLTKLLLCSEFVVFKICS